MTGVYIPVAAHQGFFAEGLVMEVCASSFGFSLNPFVSIYIYVAMRKCIVHVVSSQLRRIPVGLTSGALYSGRTRSPPCA